jgi:aspartyl-tRNA(Asn)/glutamyl-tRNA(Gln) amidotransferase subunit A
LGETAFEGACTENGALKYASAEILKAGDAMAAITFDVNGAPRRAAAQSGLCAIKPTYGTVSRFGTVPVACSGETVDVIASNAADCRAILDAIVGHDDKDGTSLPQSQIDAGKADAKPIRRVAILTDLTDTADAEMQAKVAEFCNVLAKCGVETAKIESPVIAASRIAWNVLMSAELCNNVSRYDGVKYGYRAENFSGLDELYTNSRTEAFGELLKSTILFGSETLSTENYMKVYDKSLRTRRVIVEEFAKIFADFDAVLVPAASALSYAEDAVKANQYLVFEENRYTAPASVTGLPALVISGVQLVGRAFSEGALLDLAACCEKEGV